MALFKGRTYSWSCNDCEVHLYFQLENLCLASVMLFFLHELDADIEHIFEEVLQFHFHSCWRLSLKVSAAVLANHLFSNLLSHDRSRSQDKTMSNAILLMFLRNRNASCRIFVALLSFVACWRGLDASVSRW